jgi:hypothetical protein
LGLVPTVVILVVFASFELCRPPTQTCQGLRVIGCKM